MSALSIEAIKALDKCPRCSFSGEADYKPWMSTRLNQVRDACRRCGLRIVNLGYGDYQLKYVVGEYEVIINMQTKRRCSFNSCRCAVCFGGRKQKQGD